MSRTNRWIAASILTLVASGATLCQGAGKLAEVARIRTEWHVQIILRDGVHLDATLYVPKNQSSPAPCILTLTPYGSDRYHDLGIYFAAHGYPFLIVDARGRGNSEGQFRPFIQEANDGYDVVEWLANQSYCNGKIGMWGGSYAGYDQWATAKELPPHLATIVPAAAPYLGVDVPWVSNIFDFDSLHWLTLVGGRSSQWKIYSDKPFWATQFREWYESGRPFSDLDKILGSPSATFQQWLSHPQPDWYWDAYNPTDAQYALLRIPILTITGSYDSDQLGALAHYRRHMRAAAPGARARHYLIIGPWDHAGTRSPQAEVGGLKFGPSSLLDLNKLHLDWYAWTLQGGPKPDFLKDRVAYYVMGLEEWHYAGTLEGVTGRSQAYFLDSVANATNVFHAGWISPASPSSGKPDHYNYDPRDLSDGELKASLDTDSLVDQRMVYAASGHELVYHSPPFNRATEISGFFKLSVWLSIDQPDTDFSAAVYEITPDGNSVVLTTATLRARYRDNPREPKLVRTPAPLLYPFDSFSFVSREVQKGSRLRLVLSPLYPICCNVIYPEKNFNAGGAVADESVKDARTVTVTLYHDGAHASVLYVPIGQSQNP